MPWCVAEGGPEHGLPPTSSAPHPWPRTSPPAHGRVPRVPEELPWGVREVQSEEAHVAAPASETLQVPAVWLRCSSEGAHQAACLGCASASEFSCSTANVWKSVKKFGVWKSMMKKFSQRLKISEKLQPTFENQWKSSTDI